MGFMTSSENLMPVSSGFHSVFWRGRSQGFLTLNQHLTGLGRSPLRTSHLGSSIFSFSRPA